MSKLLLLLGPSGVGKSTIIDELCRIDDRFIYISPYTTRPLREGEKSKVSISNKEMDERWSKGEFLVVNSLYGICYATPRLPIVRALAEERFPVLDWPISRISIMVQAFLGQLYVVYVLPPSVEVLSQRLGKDARDIDGRRLQSAREELDAYRSSTYMGIADFEIVAEENHVSKAAREIYANYLK